MPQQSPCPTAVDGTGEDNWDTILWKSWWDTVLVKG